MSRSRVVTMHELERAAEQHIRALNTRLGLGRPVQAARVFPAVRERGRVEEYLKGRLAR